MNVKASPDSPQPKQWYSLFSALTLNDGVRSSWKGQRPVQRLPTRRRSERAPTSSTMSTASLTRSIDSFVYPMRRRLGGDPECARNPPVRWGGLAQKPFGSEMSENALSAKRSVIPASQSTTRSASLASVTIEGGGLSA